MKQPIEEKFNTLTHYLSTITPLGDEAISLAKTYFIFKSFDERIDIISAGDKVKNICFISSGLVRFYYLTENGKDFNKSFASQGEIISSISSLITDEASPFFVETLLPTECFCISYDDFVLLTESHVEWNRLAMKLLEFLALKKEKREADFLLLSAQKRYEGFLYELAHLEKKIPNYHIASYLGITEVALSRIRKRLGLTLVNDEKVE
ncbi:MAG: Crp/Fnr family transcriptional regulator [Epsilonproteobacteria bacterium]|nr:Crp/Fnr family transcriptional regulator [Campylobacterota bacterium]